jgi:hypothetical protein
MGVSMNDAPREEIRRALTLIEEAKGILEMVLSQEQEDFDKMPEDVQNDDEGERAAEAIIALERAANCCNEAISACEEALQD